MFGIKLKHIIITLLLLFVDLVVYIFLGIAMMRYDDFYDESKGPYFSWESMDMTDKIIFGSFQTWNLINLGVVVFFIFWLIKTIKTHYNKS